MLPYALEAPHGFSRGRWIHLVSIMGILQDIRKEIQEI
jgi:hypothetical protein